MSEVLVTCPNCNQTHAVDVGLVPNGAEDRLYRLAEVEKILGLSRRTIKQFIYDRKLAAQKLTDGPAAAWHVRASDLNAFRRSRGEM